MKTILFLALFFVASFGTEYKILNVSYDPTRELFKEYNKEFIKYYEWKTGNKVEIYQSHGASGSQARSIIDGNKAGVVTLALAYDIDAIAKKGFIKKDWREDFSNGSSPYYSTIVFLVRLGNPKGIKDWNDLIKDDIKIITPNPKTSGGARWNHLAALAYALKHHSNARDFLIKLYKNVPVLDSGARGATNTFVKRNVGDVLIAWENEANLVVKKFGSDKFEIVIPSISVLAELPVALVDTVVDKNGTREVAKEYLAYLYTPKAQEIIAKNYYRPIDSGILNKYHFPQLELVDIDFFGGWENAYKEHFSDGGELDKIFKAIRDSR